VSGWKTFKLQRESYYRGRQINKIPRSNFERSDVQIKTYDLLSKEKLYPKVIVTSDNYKDTLCCEQFIKLNLPSGTYNFEFLCIGHHTVILNGFEVVEERIAELEIFIGAEY
jgi:hypothetical protein